MGSTVTMYSSPRVSFCPIQVPVGAQRWRAGSGTASWANTAASHAIAITTAIKKILLTVFIVRNSFPSVSFNLEPGERRVVMERCRFCEEGCGLFANSVWLVMVPDGMSRQVSKTA